MEVLSKQCLEILFLNTAWKEILSNTIYIFPPCSFLSEVNLFYSKKRSKNLAILENLYLCIHYTYAISSTIKFVWWHNVMHWCWKKFAILSLCSLILKKCNLRRVSHCLPQMIIIYLLIFFKTRAIAINRSWWRWWWF